MLMFTQSHHNPNIQRSRGWCFTLNNWDGTSLGILQTRFETGNPVYVCWGKETGQSGTPHLQGYARFRDAIGLSGVRKLLETAHWEPRKGTEPQAIAYCEKDGDFTELGDRAAPGKRTDVTSFLACVREGAGALELSESHPLEFVKFHRAAEVLRGGMGIPRQEKTTVHWYHGSTGTGKSRQAFEENEGAYWKDMSNGQWWDGYEQQECVVFDDMRKDTFKFHELLRLFDRYPLRIQVKGGYREFNSKKIIVTSCTTPDDMYATRCDEDMQQLLRRVEVIKHFS